MNVLVTGASGFLGGHIVDRCLQQGDDVRVMVRPTSDLTYLQTLPSVRFIDADLHHREALEAAVAGVDVVYHSAARVGERGTRRQFLADNLDGTRLLLEAARHAGVRRFVFVSSPSVVGTGKDQPELDERCPYPTSFLNPYSESKALAEQLVLASNDAQFTTCAIRPRAVWGPRDRTGVLTTLVSRLMSKRLPDLSGGKRIDASICYCTNAADAIVRAGSATEVGAKAYFITDAERLDVWALLRRLAVTFHTPPITRAVSPSIARAAATAVDALWRFPPLAARRSPPLSRYALSLLTCTSTYTLAAARRDLDYVPTVDLEAGLGHLIRFVDDIGGAEEFIRLVR